MIRDTDTSYIIRHVVVYADKPPVLLVVPADGSAFAIFFVFGYNILHISSLNGGGVYLIT